MHKNAPNITCTESVSAVRNAPTTIDRPIIIIKYEMPLIFNLLKLNVNYNRVINIGLIKTIKPKNICPHSVSVFGFIKS